MVGVFKKFQLKTPVNINIKICSHDSQKKKKFGNLKLLYTAKKRRNVLKIFELNRNKQIEIDNDRNRNINLRTNSCNFDIQ